MMISLRRKYMFVLSISFFFFSLSLFLSSQNPPSPHSSHSPVKKKPVHLLVLSSWRSGSSFLGQIFNHHDDVFYLYEPGHAVWKKFQNESFELLHFPLRDLLRSLFNCDVSPLQHYLPNGKYISEIGFYGESRALCTPKACPAFRPSEGYSRLKCYHHCGTTSLDKMAEVCKTYSHVVMKTVRVLDLAALLPLFQDPALDLRILHLVRDPRAVALSRKFIDFRRDNRIVLKKDGNSDKEMTIDKVMEKICKAQVDISNVAKAAKLLGGRYMAIRHEDLATEPRKNVQKIYSFADLHLTKDLEEWTYKITHEEAANNGEIKFSLVSSKVLQKWRASLDFQFVKKIQEKCKEAMDLFGYKPARSQHEQKQMTLDLTIKEWSLE